MGSRLEAGRASGPYQGTSSGEFLTPRDQLIEAWKISPARTINYPAGISPDGVPYFAGRRLLVGNEQVMDTCETPWARATVDSLFENIDSPKPDILERGFGLGITSSLIIQKLIGLGGGSLTIIELNSSVAASARKFADDIGNNISRLSRPLPQTKPDVKITVIEGDAYQETQALVENGIVYDAILSDTYPLATEDNGINDIADLAVLKRALKPNGQFAFFAYYGESQGDVSPFQKGHILPHFEEYRVSSVGVSPPPEYKYLHQGSTPIRRLPVVICTKPIF